MNIGFDLDGVFINQEKFQLDKGIKYFKKQYIKNNKKLDSKKIKPRDIQVVDVLTGKIFKSNKEVDYTQPFIKIKSNGYGISDVFMCSKEEEEKFWVRHMPQYALFAPFRKDSDLIAKRLHDEGNKIIILTSRAKSNETSAIGMIQRAMVKLRFKIKGIPYDKIVFCEYKNGHEIQDKCIACIDNDIDLMIEDKLSTAESIESRTKTQNFLMATRNNADLKNPKIQRFVNFIDLYNGIKKKFSKDKFVLLSREEKSKLSAEDLETYYQKLREYYQNQKYDQDIVLNREEKVKKAIKFGKFFFDKYAKHQVINSQNIPVEDGVVITLNHRDMLDIPLVITSMGLVRAYHPMLKAEFLDTKAEGILTDLGSIFVNRNDKSSRTQARENAIRYVLNGSNVIICPEGTRNKTDKPLLDFDYGAVSTAQNSGKKIYPCAIYRDVDKKIVNFGQPIEVGISDNLETANNLLFGTTIRLLEECEKHSSRKLQEASLVLKK